MDERAQEGHQTATFSEARASRSSRKSTKAVVGKAALGSPRGLSFRCRDLSP